MGILKLSCPNKKIGSSFPESHIAPTGADERVPVYSWYVSILVMSSLRRKESDFKLDL